MRALLIGLVLFAACGHDSVCELKAKPSGGDACAPGVVPNTTAGACKDSMGNAYICRGGLGFCVVCTGGNFGDGCTLNPNGTLEYCVHDCDHC
jgi:hypothetical protein